MLNVKCIILCVNNNKENVLIINSTSFRYTILFKTKLILEKKIN